MPKKTPVKKKPVTKASPHRKKPVPKSSQAWTNPLGLVAYGPSGVGKTSCWAHAPDVGFVFDPQETGIQDLVDFKQVPEPLFHDEVDSWMSLLRTCKKIASGNTGCKWVVFDSLTGMEKLCFIDHCENHFDGDWSSKGFFSYQQGPKNAAKTDWPKFLDACNDIRNAGINVVLIAHSSVKNYSNPEGSDYDRFNPYLDKESWQQVHRWAQAVFFMNYHVEVDKKAGPKDKAKLSVDQRFMYTEWSPAYDAKNRFGLEPLIDMGDDGKEAFTNFNDAMTKAMN